MSITIPISLLNMNLFNKRKKTNNKNFNNFYKKLNQNWKTNFKKSLFLILPKMVNIINYSYHFIKIINLFEWK